jgi:arginyl-tRNA synthetase
MIRKSGLTEEQLKEADKLKVTHEYEVLILSHLSKLTYTLQQTTNELAMNKLCSYLYDLAGLLSTGYTKYKIVGNEDTHSRILVMEAVRLVMLKCFHLLAITPLEKI